MNSVHRIGRNQHDRVLMQMCMRHQPLYFNRRMPYREHDINDQLSSGSIGQALLSVMQFQTALGVDPDAGRTLGSLG